MKIFLFLSFLLINSLCKPADPNYRVKPLQNTEYTGFISRNFFQAVIEIPLTKEELSILEERKSCLKEAMKKRDTIVIPILKQIAMEDKWNERERKLEIEKADDKEKEKHQKSETKDTASDSKSVSADEPGLFDKKEAVLNISKNPSINRGEFAWFLDSMFLYKEDYSDPEKCSFVFRNIQENLFARVEKTKLSFIGEDKKKTPLPGGATSNPAGTSPLNTGLPQTIR